CLPTSENQNLLRYNSPHRAERTVLMNWLAASVRLSLASILLVQSMICVARKDRITKVGILALLLATVGFFFSVELPTGPVVISTDFSILMVQGDWHAFLVGLAIIVISLCAGLFWLNTREAMSLKHDSRLVAIVCMLGISVGIVSCLHFSVLSTSSRFLIPI